jgi:hypothetical protein
MKAGTAFSLSRIGTTTPCHSLLLYSTCTRRYTLVGSYPGSRTLIPVTRPVPTIGVRVFLWVRVQPPTPGGLPVRIPR